MATIGNSQLTLLDHAKRIDENGKIARIVEMMSKRNAALEDAVVVEGNTTSGHKTTLRTGLPTVAWRQINKGVQPTKSSTSQIEFTAGMLEAHGQVDEELVNLASDKQAFRLSENAPFIEAMTQTLATTMFYGNVNTNPERFMGLAPYYSSLSAASGANIVDGGGTGSDNTSGSARHSSPPRRFPNCRRRKTDARQFRFTTIPQIKGNEKEMKGKWQIYQTKHD